MSVLARFYIASSTRHAHSPGSGQVKLNAVTRGEENKTWAAATPSGTIDMVIANPAALAFFDDNLGKEVVISFSLAPLTCVKCKRETEPNVYGTDRLGGYNVDASNRNSTPSFKIGDHVCTECAREDYENTH